MPVALQNIEARQIVNHELTDQLFGENMIPERPASHANFDPETITRDGVIKACHYFAEIAKRDPQLAMTQAEIAVDALKEDAAMRQQGMDSEAIKSQKWAAMHNKHKEKTKAEQKPEPELRPMSQSKSEKLQVTQPTKAKLDHAQNSIHVEQTLYIPKPIVKQPETFSVTNHKQKDEKPPLIDPSVIAEVIAHTSQQQAEMAINSDRIYHETTKSINTDNAKDELRIEPAQQTKTDALDRTLSDVQTDSFSAPETARQVPDFVYEVDTSQTLHNDKTEVPQPSADTTDEAIEAYTAETESDTVQISDSVSIDVEVDMPASSPSQIVGTFESDVLDAEPQTALVSEVALDERLGLQFEPEVVDTYKELLAVIEADTAEADETTDEFKAFEAKTVPREEPEPAPDFEAFLALQPEPEESIPLEIIVEQAPKQPLEQTIVQLAQYLSDTLQQTQEGAELSDEPMPELSGHGELRAIVQDIAEILPSCHSVNEENQEKRIQITPEMTQKLLVLLRSLGYERPREVLVEFVRLRGLTFLLQALEYMCQQGNKDERQEFFAITNTPTSTSSTVDLGSILGNAVLRLLAVNIFASEY